MVIIESLTYVLHFITLTTISVLYIFTCQNQLWFYPYSCMVIWKSAATISEVRGIRDLLTEVKDREVVIGPDFISLRVTKLARTVSTAYWRMKWGMGGREIWDTECLKINPMWKHDKEEIPLVFVSLFLFSLSFCFS